MAEGPENRPVDAFKENEAVRDGIDKVLSEIVSERFDLLDRLRSSPESFERDKALVEELGKQWDIVKAGYDDISRKNEKYGLETAIEGAKMAYDWYKHLTTVSTGSVLLITAVTKALFPDPSVAVLLVVALAGFLLCALVSVLAMAGSADVATATPAVDESGRGPLQRWLWEKFRSQGVQEGLLYFAVVSFVLGMLSFTVFAAFNVI